MSLAEDKATLRWLGPKSDAVTRILEVLDEAEKVLDVCVVSHDRLKGYPTGPEWIEIVAKAREFLKRLRGE